jgi:hypothetical protein
MWVCDDDIQEGSIKGVSKYHKYCVPPLDVLPGRRQCALVRDHLIKATTFARSKSARVRKVQLFIYPTAR